MADAHHTLISQSLKNAMRDVLAGRPTPKE
jgi:hypothetical protein